MSLHHRREMHDIRAAYTHNDTATAMASRDQWAADVPRSHREVLRGLDQSASSTPSGCSSRVRQPTNNVIHYDNAPPYFDDGRFQESPRSSDDSVVSIVESEEDFTDDLPDYDVPDLSARPCNDGSRILESTPKDFSELFPSTRQLLIRHDDTTLDGNMNLRIDTPVWVKGHHYDMTLFHLRMHDLKSREFSLRRHHRDSGREICHSTSKASPPKRPGFHRSLSNALNSMRPKYEHRSSTSPTLTRHDSGYGSMHSMDSNEAGRPTSSGRSAVATEESPTNTIKLEFSNYAQVEVKRAGNSSTRYEFEYWGVHYSWKRVSHRPTSSPSKSVSFHLKRIGSDAILASIDPMALSAWETAEERRKGGWVPQCTLQLRDDQILRSQKDVSDVVVAVGLMALVDDSIRARFLSKTQKSILVPNMHSPQHGPKQLINDMFNRQDYQPGGDGARLYGGPQPGDVRRAHYTF